MSKIIHRTSQVLKEIPFLRRAVHIIRSIPFALRIEQLLRGGSFKSSKLNADPGSEPFNSKSYWQTRYAKGGNSGDGSRKELAEFKADLINGLVEKHDITTVIDFGCGDGWQLSLAKYKQYHGFDVSTESIEQCRTRFLDDHTKSFDSVDDYAGQHADLALSLDVIYHLVEDVVFDAYMRRLFSAAESLVVIYSSNKEQQEENQQPHVRHRMFTKWIEANMPDWLLLANIKNKHPYIPGKLGGSFAEFFVFGRE